MTNVEVLMALKRIGVSGIENIIKGIIEPKQNVIAELIYNRINLGNGYYFTYRWNKDIIVDTNTGDVYRIYNNKYQSIAYHGELTIRNRKTGVMQEVLKNGVLDFGAVKAVKGYTYVGTNNYAAVNLELLSKEEHKQKHGKRK